MEKVLAFDISAQYGHFKVIYATTSALTYPIPSKTAIYGLVGNIIGLSNKSNEYLKSFKEGKCWIAIQVLNPISTQRININWSASPGAIKQRKPTLVEHLSKPAYRVYFAHEDDALYQNLKEHLKNHTSVYTPCMGLAYLLANFEFQDEYEIEKKAGAEIDVHSIVPMSVFESFGEEIERDNFITSMSQYAVEMTPQRDVTKREEVLFDRQGLPIRAKVKNYYQLEGSEKETNIILF